MTCLVAVEQGPGGSARYRLRRGAVVPRVTRVDGSTVHVTLVAATATLLGGDDLRLELTAGPGTDLVVTDVAATVAYDGRGAPATWRAEIGVAADARLAWHGEALVVTDGADVTRALDAQVACGGRLLLRDTLALGRSGQRGGAVRSRTRIDHDGRPALVEDLTVDGAPGPGMLGPAAGGPERAVDSVTAVGWRPPPVEGAFDLAAPGALHRVVLDQAHLVPLRRTWSSWREDLEAGRA